MISSEPGINDTSKALRHKARGLHLIADQKILFRVLI